MSQLTKPEIGLYTYKIGAGFGGRNKARDDVINGAVLSSCCRVLKFSGIVDTRHSIGKRQPSSPPKSIKPLQLSQLQSNLQKIGLVRPRFHAPIVRQPRFQTRNHTVCQPRTRVSVCLDRMDKIITFPRQPGLPPDLLSELQNALNGDVYNRDHVRLVAHASHREVRR